MALAVSETWGQPHLFLEHSGREIRFIFFHLQDGDDNAYFLPPSLYLDGNTCDVCGTKTHRQQAPVRGRRSVTVSLHTARYVAGAKSKEKNSLALSL